MFISSTRTLLFSIHYRSIYLLNKYLQTQTNVLFFAHIISHPLFLNHTLLHSPFL
jgi:hypothetical protein